jgi:hypothetical protein
MNSSDETRPLSKRVTTAARRIENQAQTLDTPDTCAEKDKQWICEVLIPLRKLTREAANRLRRHGFLDEGTGTECIRPQTWKDRREDTDEEHLYLYLLRDCMDCDFLFNKHHHLYSDDDTFREAVLDGQVGGRLETNIVTTFTWLDQIDAPTNLRSR